ncbi:hypothetical protein KKC17_00475 [Patescibacteria group bacterium]|nr:hypothetical protein [Patescibacteria group bacterium]
MSDRHLLNQIKELQNLKQAPVLWRQELRQTLLNTVAQEKTSAYSFKERVWLWAKETRLVVAPFRLAPIVAAVFLLIGGTVPVARATNQSLPGQTLYSVKRLAEKVQLSFQTNPLSRGLYYLDLANQRLVEINKLAGQPADQANLLRDYNISVGFAQASLQAAGQEANLVALYDSASQRLAQQLINLKDKVGEEAGYKAAIKVTEKLSDSSLALLVNFGAPENDGQVLANRLQSQITKAEAKLDGVDGRIIRLPQTKPLKVVIESKKTVVPVKEASKQAKASLNEARELIEKKFYTLALQKVQEGEEITNKAEEVIDSTEQPESKVEGVQTEKPAEPLTNQPNTKDLKTEGETVELK